MLIPANTGRNAICHPDSSIVYLQVYVADMKQFPILPCCIKWFFPFIDRVLEKGETVLVHCAAGKSRSAGVVIGYLMYRQSLSFEEALGVVRKARPQVSTKFEDQLKLWNVDEKMSPFAKVMFASKKEKE